MCVCVATIEKKFSSKKAYTLHSSENWKGVGCCVQVPVWADFFYGAAQKSAEAEHFVRSKCVWRRGGEGEKGGEG